MNEKNFGEGLALGFGNESKGGLANDWFSLILLAILLSPNRRGETEVARKEFDELRAAVEALKGGARHDE